MNLLFILLDEATTQKSNPMMMIIMMVAIIAIFYFMMIRPQQKKQKKLREERASLSKGDNIITSGGIYGKIKEVREDSFLIEIDQNVKVRVDKNMVYKVAADAIEASQQTNDKK